MHSYLVIVAVVSTAVAHIQRFPQQPRALNVFCTKIAVFLMLTTQSLRVKSLEKSVLKNYPLNVRRIF